MPDRVQAEEATTAAMSLPPAAEKASATASFTGKPPSPPKLASIAPTSLMHLEVGDVHVQIPSSPSSKASPRRGPATRPVTPTAPAPATTTQPQGTVEPLSSPPNAPPPASPRGSFFSSLTGGIPQQHPTKGETPLKILVGSWNVGNAMPPKSKELLSQWVPEGGGGFDVIAIGLQESSYREKTTTSASPSAANAVDGATTPKMSRKSSRATSKAASQGDGSGGDGGGGGGDGSAPGEAAGGAADEDRDDGQDDDDDDDAGDEGEEDGDDEGDSGDGDGNGDTEDAATRGSPLHLLGDVIVKKSRAKRSIRKVSKLMRQVSSNFRDSVVDALDYPFNKQLYMHLGDQYALVGKVELLEMRLFVYVHVKHPVTLTEKLTVATGLGSVIGNKGGLLFKMVVANTSLCFVSCHLAAHQDQKFLDKRNADCASILGANGVGLKHVQLDCQFDHCFWLGDLNYRIDLNYSTPQKERTHEQHFDDVLALVRAKKWSVLNANDQLRHQITDKKVLFGWELPQALFPPTFKRERHTKDTYNPQRVPSFCDRVLHKSLPGLRGNLQCNSFHCVEDIATSDHKPVAAHFTVLSTPRIQTPTDESERTKSVLSRTTTVEFRELSAKDLLGMDISGKSDPYIKFYSLPEQVLQREPNGSHPSTATIMNTLTPAWKNDQIPKLSLFCESETDARRVHLVLLVMDYDATSSDDSLGNVVLSLDKLCHGSSSKQPPKFLPFEAPVVRHGKPAGIVSGKVRVVLPHQQHVLSGGANGDGCDEVALRVAGCHCNLS